MKRFFFFLAICLFIVLTIYLKSALHKEPTKPVGSPVSEEVSINSFVAIDPRALERAQYIVRQMLLNSPELKKKMIATGYTIEIIGQKQNVSDLPRYKHLKNQKTFDGRSFDSGTRGLGDEKACSVGEENLLCFPDQKYYEENILVHEFAHSIKFLMPADISQRIDWAYTAAKKKKLYPKDIYMMASSQEYWAEATQAWFNATVRRDVNAGINTRESIKRHDPEVAELLELTYGKGEILHQTNCPY